MSLSGLDVTQPRGNGLCWNKGSVEMVAGPCRMMHAAGMLYLPQWSITRSDKVALMTLRSRELFKVLEKVPEALG